MSDDKGIFSIEIKGGAVTVGSNISMRAYIATAVLPGLMGREWSKLQEEKGDDELIKVWAKSSVAIADALIAELSK